MASDLNLTTFREEDRACSKSYSLLRPKRSRTGGRYWNGSCLLQSGRKFETCLNSVVTTSARCLGSSSVTVALLRGALKTAGKT